MRTRRFPRVVGGALCLCVLAVSPAGAAGPLRSLPPSRAFSGTCSVPSPSPTRQAVCDSLALAAINSARAAEGVGPMGLPAQFDREGVAAQALTLVNEERVDRGLAPVKGVSSALDRWARAGAQSGLAPSFPSPLPGSRGGAVWSSVWSPLLADYLFVYDDGLGGVNLDCQSGRTSACWGHRRILLARYGGPLVMGVAAVGRGGGVSGFTAELIGGDRLDHADVVTWSSLRRTLRPGVSTSSLATTSTRRTAQVLVAASGEQMSIQLSTTSANWMVTPALCVLRAGHSCVVTVESRSASPSSALLLATGPGGASTVSLRQT